MTKITPILLALIFIFSACSTPDLPPPTSIVISSPPPTKTPLPTATATTEPTAVPVAMSEFGVTDQVFADQLKAEGIDTTVTGEKGNWQVGKVVAGYNKDGGEIVEQNVKIVSFARNYQVDMSGNVLMGADGQPVSTEDLHNPVTNNILTGLDSQRKIVFWSESDKSWHRPVFSTDINNMVVYKTGTQLPIEMSLLNPEINKPLTDQEIAGFQQPNIYYEKGKDGSSKVFLQGNTTEFKLMCNADEQLVWFTDGESQTTITRLQFKPNKQILLQVDTGLLNADINKPHFGAPLNPEYQGINENIPLTLLKAYLDPNTIGVAKIDPRLEFVSQNGFFAKNNFNIVPRPSLDELLTIERINQLGNFGEDMTGRLNGTTDSNWNSFIDTFPKIQNFIWGITF